MDFEAKDVILASLPILVTEVVAHFFPAKKHLVLAVIAVAFVGACLGKVFGLPGHDPMSSLAVCVVIVTIGVVVFTTFLSRFRTRESMAASRTEIDSLGQRVKSLFDEQTAHRDQLRRDAMGKIDAEIKRVESSLGDRALRLEKWIDSLGSRVDGQEGVAAEDIRWLKSAVELIHLELRKIPARWEENLKQIRGPERVVHRNGERSVRPPRFSNIEDLSEHLSEVSRRVETMGKTVDVVEALTIGSKMTP